MKKRWSIRILFCILGLLLVLFGKRVEAADTTQCRVNFYSPYEATARATATFSIYDADTGNVVSDSISGEKLENISTPDRDKGTTITLQSGKNYIYKLYRRGKLQIKGIFRLKSYETEKTVKIITLRIGNGRYVSCMNIRLTDTDGFEVPIAEEVSKKSETVEGEYTRILYGIEAGVNYTLEVESHTLTTEGEAAGAVLIKKTDKVFYASEDDPSNNYVLYQSVPEDISINCEEPKLLQLKLPKGTNPKVYYHPGRAYVQMQELPIQVTTEGEYDICDIRCGQDNDLILVAGGNGTDYRKTVVQIRTQPKYDHPLMEIPVAKKTQKTEGTNLSERLYGDTYNDLYTNAENGYMTLKTGDVTNLEGYRVAQTTTNDTDNKFVEPDMHYEIVTGNDVVSLEDAGGVGRPYQKLTALKEGIAVIKITYDAMDTVTLNDYDGTCNVYPMDAIDPENTGIVIVKVGGSSDESLYKGLDLSDFDTVYIPEKIVLPDGTVQQESNTVDYTFKLEAGNVNVSLHAPLTVNANWNDWESCTPEEDGSYTLHLQAGRNIVRISSGDKTVYKVIKAKKTAVTITNETREGKTPQSGDTVHIAFEGLTMPIYKMTAIYNPGYEEKTWLQYTENEDGQVESRHTQYKLHAVSSLDIAVNEARDIQLTNGQIHCDQMSKPDVNHYSIPMSGRGQMFNAVRLYGSYSILPDITIPVVGKEVGVMDLINEIDTENYLGCIDKIMEARDAYAALTEEERAKVTNADVLNTAYEAVKDIVELIKSIDALPDEVTLDNQEAVEAANAAYTAMTPERQAAVSNADKLKNAVTVIQALLARQDRIQAVITQINALPETAKVTKADAEAIAAARAAYDALLPDEQDEVTNVAKLTETETQLGYVKAASTVTDAINAIGDVTLDNYETKYELIVTARSAYDNLADGAKALVTNLDVLTKAEETYQVMDEDVKEVIEAINQLKDPLSKSSANMDANALYGIWNEYTYVVVNIRGLADELTKDKQAIVTNMKDLETAEAYIQKIKDYDQKLAEQDTAAKIATGNYVQAEKLLSAEGFPKFADYDPTNADKKDIAKVAAQVAQAQAVVKTLTDEQKAALDEELGAGTIKNLNDLADLAKAVEGYDGQYKTTQDELDKAAEKIRDEAAASQYVSELTEVYDTYKDKEVSRSDIAIIRQTIKAYDNLTDAQKDIIKNAEDASTITEMLNALKEQDEQVQKDEKAAAEVTEYIKNLPTSLNLDNMEAVRSDLQMIADKYNALNANARSYVRMRSKVTATNNVLNTMTAEINTFRQGKPAVTAAATAYNCVTVSWNTYQYAQSYDVYRKTAGGEWTKLGNTTALQYVDQTAAGSTAYSYTVVALSSRWGQSVSSAYDENGAAVTTPAAPQPDNGNTTPDNGNTTPDNNNTPAVKDYTSLKATSAGVSSIKLSWKKVSKASGYVVYRANSANGKYKAIKTIKKGKTTSFTDKKRTTGKTYYYKLRPYKTVKNKKQYMDYSSVVSTKAVPGRVKFTKLTAGNQKATLKWKKVSGASGYLLYRSDRRDGGFTCINSVSRRKTSYTNTKLKKGQTYYYRIRAYRKVGGKRVYGNFSVVKAVKVK